MDNINLLKKYALAYLSKYDSSKRNLERILINKIYKMKNIKKNEKNTLFKNIKEIVNNLEFHNIIDDENFTNKKIISLINQGKSERFIIHTLKKKGVNEKIIFKLLSILEVENPEWKIESARKFATKRKLGKLGTNNKTKDLAIMARAGFDYNIALKALGYD